MLIHQEPRKFIPFPQRIFMKDIYLKSDKEIKIMQEGGQKLSDILIKLIELTNVGVNLLDIEKKAVQLIKQTGGQPSFKKVPGYYWATCININEGVVHGIPKDYKIRDGDVVTIDTGLYYKGFNTDTSWTICVKSQKFHQRGGQAPVKSQNYKEKELFLAAGRKALREAIKQVKPGKPGNRIGHISAKIQQIIEQTGYYCVRSLTGHGVGFKLHEGPAIPCFLEGKINETPLIKKGMTLAIEVIYTTGSPDLVIDPKDKWTIRTKNGKIAAVFEESIAVLNNGPLVLTKIHSLP